LSPELPQFCLVFQNRAILTALQLRDSGIEENKKKKTK